MCHAFTRTKTNWDSLAKLLTKVQRGCQAHIDVEVESSEARQAREDAEQAAAAADELARFDAELAERARERQVNQGTRWTL